MSLPGNSPVTGDGSTGNRVTPRGPRPGDRADPTGTVTAVGDPDRAAVRAWAGELTGTAAARWLTAGTVTAVGKGMAVAITRHRRAHGGYPTWVQALTAVDPALLTPMSAPPDGRPFTAAVWWRQLRVVAAAAAPADGAAQIHPVDHLHPPHPDRCGSAPAAGPG